MRTENNLRLEAISYQPNDHFPIAFSKIIAEAREEVKMNPRLNTKDLLTVYAPRMESLIKARYGMKVVVDLDMWVITMAGIFPFSNDTLSRATMASDVAQAIESGSKVSAKDVNKKIQKVVTSNKAVAKSSNNKKGSIDLKRAKVSGYFSDMGNYLLIDIVLLIKLGLTDLEITAIVCHELGHAFHGFEYHARMVTTNAIMSDVIDALDGNNTEKAYYIFKSKFTPTELAESALTKDSTITDFYGAIAGRYIKIMQSQYGYGFNDRTKFESLADNFASRMGLGQEIISGLSKIYKHHAPVHISNSLKVAANVVETLTLGILGFAATVAMSPLFALVTVAAVTIIAGKHDMESQHKVYDNFKDRGLRLQRDINNVLKDPSLKPDCRANLVKQWEMLDSLNKTSTNYLHITEHIYKFLAPSARRAYGEKERQQNIEKLLNNDLFTLTTAIDILGDTL